MQLKKFFQWIINSSRSTFASIIEQIFYYIAIFIGFLTWGYFKSITAAVVGFIAVLFAWFISGGIEDKQNN